MAISQLMELIALGADASIVCLLYYFYRHKVKDADRVQNAPSFVAGSDELLAAMEEATDKSLPYVCVEGVTQATGPPLRSQFRDEMGVVQHQLFVEHKSKRLQGIWSDVQRVIRDVTNVAPFQIVAPVPPRSERFQHERNRVRITGVDVVDVLSAEYLREGMTQTFDRYEPNKDGFASRTLDRVFGELTKGYQETERMLGVGVPIIGIGRLTLYGSSDRRLRLESPFTGEKYIVTTMSKTDVIRALKSDARVLKAFLWIFTVLGVGLAAYFLYPKIQRIKRDMEFKRRLAQVRLEAANRVDGGVRAANEAADVDEGQLCVVCQSERRDVIALDCGHFCLCSNCSTALTEPKLCPVCRAPVARFLPVFVS